MKCYKCSKEMGREYSRATLTGIDVDVTINLEPVLPEDIAYYNLQLGKYSNGNGECHIAICYECYIDGLFFSGGKV